MRILKVVQSYFPFQDQGGPVVKVRALAHGLAKRGHQVTVLTADLGLKKTDGFNMPFATCKWGYCAEENGVKAVYLSTVAHYRAMTLNPGVIGFSRASLRQFDMVHFYGLYDLLGPAVSYYCRNQNVPYVVEPMGMFRPIDRSFRLKRMWHHSVGAAYWTHAAQIVTTSELEQEELLAEGVPAEKVVIRYNGIDLGLSSSLPARGSFRAKWGIGPSEPVILFLGRLIPRKGADILIEAFAKACPQSGRLVIAGPEGEPGYLEVLAKKAQAAGVSARVVFPGPLYDDAKAAALADTDLFVLPSRYENFANSAAEAMVCGIPVIITGGCGIRSLVDGRAGLVIERNMDGLAEAIVRLLTDKDLYEKFRDGCYAVTAQLGWDRLSEQMENYYADALGSRMVTTEKLKVSTDGRASL
jgi:glycosyltransferase involved in cell wall biosynthesis